MASIKIVLDHGGMDAMLKSSPVKSMVSTKAAEVATRATALDPPHESGPVTFHSGASIGRTRALAWVVAEHVMGAYQEMKHRTLGKALKGSK